MIELALIGIGTGNPDHVTLQAVEAMNTADLIMIPVKGPEKTELAELRRTLLATHLKNPETRVVEFDLPVRDAVTTSYSATVADWHGAIAQAWEAVIVKTLDAGKPGRVALLIWGDPMLYDSSLRIAGILGRRIPLRPRVIPGITAIQALCAAHAIPLNEVGAPVVITTGRQLRDHGWPDGAETVVVMLDGECSFRAFESEGIQIWWGGCVSMPQERLVAGALSDVGAKIVAVRDALRAENGWVMDIYLLRRKG